MASRAVTGRAGGIVSVAAAGACSVGRAGDVAADDGGDVAGAGAALVAEVAGAASGRRTTSRARPLIATTRVPNSPAATAKCRGFKMTVVGSRVAAGVPGSGSAPEFELG